MAHAEHELDLEQAAFRSCITGAVVATGPFHDVTLLPDGLDADLEEWQAGFLTVAGRFLDRREAAVALGHAGRLEARAYFAGDPCPTLEAGHPVSWHGRRAA
ncbi:MULTISPECIES: hypothetical protein [unclassified Anaeromyxobacter]|uniref:hypothetical protein n=1 Tax=unclassified Anaeromyxobacter TaxID=2620896 RepID=UPI001F568F67|nr:MULTISPECIES: hypothetical protein [unclassified Anaeromyxobacter]